jgi:hypothetical protein
MAVLVKKFTLFEELEKNEFSFDFKKLIAIFLICANFFTIFSISQEIVRFHDKQITKEYARSRNDYNEINSEKAQSYSSYYQTKDYKDSVEKIKKLKNKESITLSIFWLLYGIILVLIGFATKSKLIRSGGMLLLILAILKLFFYDLWNLGTLYRIISSISLGAILLAISFVYQKYRDKIKDII